MSSKGIWIHLHRYTSILFHLHYRARRVSWIHLHTYTSISFHLHCIYVYCNSTWCRRNMYVSNIHGNCLIGQIIAVVVDWPFLGLQSHFGHKPLKLYVVCSQNGTAVVPEGITAFAIPMFLFVFLGYLSTPEILGPVLPPRTLFWRWANVNEGLEHRQRLT